jgi:hypothetical protein
MGVAGLRFEHQVQHYRVAHLGRLPLDGRQHARWSEELEPVGNHAQNVAATQGEASGQHIGRIPGSPDNLLYPLQGFRGDVRPIVENARNRLDRNPGRDGDIPDRQALSTAHRFQFILIVESQARGYVLASHGLLTRV